MAVLNQCDIASVLNWNRAGVYTWPWIETSCLLASVSYKYIIKFSMLRACGVT